jgi:hypothetical protein
MVRSESENRSAFAQAIRRRERVMREMFGMGARPAGPAEDDRRPEPRAVIWRIAGDRKRRAHAGWADPAAIGAERRKAGPWLFLLPNLWSRKNRRGEAR